MGGLPGQQSGQEQQDGMDLEAEDTASVAGRELSKEEVEKAIKTALDALQAMRKGRGADSWSDYLDG